jgi:hypothetical protein
VVEPTEASTAEMESLLRLAAVRTVIDAVLIGDWSLDPATAEALGRLLADATRWHERAIALGLAA